MDLKFTTKNVGGFINALVKEIGFGKVVAAAKKFIQSLKKKLGFEEEQMLLEISRAENELDEDERRSYLESKMEAVMLLEKEESQRVALGPQQPQECLGVVATDGTCYQEQYVI